MGVVEAAKNTPPSPSQLSTELWMRTSKPRRQR